MRKLTALAFTGLIILAAGCGRQSAPAPSPSAESAPSSSASQESTVAATSQDPRVRLPRAIPVQLAPDLPATVHTLPEAEQPAQGGPLLVTTESGRVLLERTTGVVAFVGVRQAETPLPLLVLEVVGGGSMGSYYEAYRYDVDQDQLVRVPWDSQTFAISTSGVEEGGGLLRTTGRSEAAVGRRVVTILWQYRNGALQRVETKYSPPPYPNNDQDVLLLAFDTVAKRLPDETSRYFADPEQARRFYAELVDQIPDGFPFCAECEYQRLPSQGPVFVWVADGQMRLPPSRLFAVTPHFRAGPLGPQITAMTETPQTLRVPDVAAAVQLLIERSELRQRSIPEPDFQGGFWVVQVPGAGVWRINPRTGEAQHN